jgi:hypothetical protein
VNSANGLLPCGREHGGDALKLNKVDVARRQLAAALEMWFAAGDPVAMLFSRIGGANHRLGEDMEWWKENQTGILIFIVGILICAFIGQHNEYEQELAKHKVTSDNCNTNRLANGLYIGAQPHFDIDFEKQCKALGL